MHFSLTKFSLAIVTFFLLFTFTFASPIAEVVDSNTDVAARQESNGIYYGDACGPGDIGEDELMLSISSKIINEGQSNQYLWSTIFLFANSNCDLIGYVPGVNLEGNWFSMDSQLPLTIDIIAHGGEPQFKYGGDSYNTPNNQWRDNNGAGSYNTLNFQFYWIDF